MRISKNRRMASPNTDVIYTHCYLLDNHTLCHIYIIRIQVGVQQIFVLWQELPDIPFHRFHTGTHLIKVTGNHLLSPLDTATWKQSPGYWYFALNWSSHSPSSTKQKVAPCKSITDLSTFLLLHKTNFFNLACGLLLKYQIMSGKKCFKDPSPKQFLSLREGVQKKFTFLVVLYY